MLTGPTADNLVAAVASACRSGLDADSLRAAVLPRLRKAVPIDALWWASADPATLLFTRSYREELPETSGPYFVDNEFLHQDVNKWTELACQATGVGTLMQATGGHPASSDRYRDIFAPLGLQDELRAVLRIRDTCWGYICLHREGPQVFSRDEARFIQRLAPHLAEGLRQGLLRQACHLNEAQGGPGLVMLAADGAVAGLNGAAGQWLEDLGGHADGSDLPIEISALAARLRHLPPTEPAMPRLQVRTRSGRWAVLHASWMNAPAEKPITVIIQEAAPAEVAPLIMAAYGLTDRERTISALVCQGMSTRQIAGQLHLTADTVQDHLKSVFDRTGVHSRGQLVATIFERDYLPHAIAGDPLNPAGAFTAG
ncbi:MAG TPA: helix-turn-helix transcriptional regulator [Streptosporangiaceae bacterium]